MKPKQNKQCVKNGNCTNPKCPFEHISTPEKKYRMQEPLDQLSDKDDCPKHDQKKECVRCRKDFVLMVGEQKWFEKNHMNMPKRCKECRLLAKTVEFSDD